MGDLTVTKNIQLVDNKVLTCPRCHSTEFTNVDCGPDTYEDDIFYISHICIGCKLWWNGWDGKWLVGCETYGESLDAMEYLWQK